MFINNSPGTGSHIITECQPIIREKKNSLIEKLTKMPQSVVGIFLLIMLKSVIVQSQSRWDKVKLINFAATKSHKLPFDLRQLTFNWW